MGFDEIRPYWSGLYNQKIFFSYDRCLECGLLFCSRFFTAEQLTDLYAAMSPNMEDVTTDALTATQHGYFAAARKAVPMTGGYLEIGPDVGFIVKRAAEQGHFEHFWLFEPNRAVHQALAAATGGKSCTISENMSDLSAVPDGSIGWAVAIQVLDHLLDPIATLRQIRSKLRPGGALIIVAHNEGSLLRHLMSGRWPPFCLQHPQLFNPASIRVTLGRAGFDKVVVTRSVNYFPLGFMVRQAAHAVRLDLRKLPLPSVSIGLKLGNMIVVAS